MICKNFEEKVCLSCSLLSLKNEDPLKFKLEKALKTLKQDHFDSVTHYPDESYRNKAKWAISGSVEEPRFGFFDRELSFHHLEFCPILMNELNLMQKNLKKVIQDFNLTPYDPKTNTGELKYILLFSDPTSQNLILRFVLRSKEAIDRLKTFVKRKDEYGLEKVSVISVNLQPKNAAIIEGETEIPLTNETEISFKLNQTKLFLGIRSFFQINHNVAKDLYKKAYSLLENDLHHHILDLYCGVGGFALTVAPLAKKISGIEISKEAIKTATLAAAENNLKHIKFYDSDLKKTDLTPFLDIDVCILNPPRRGIDQNTVDFLQKVKPKKVLYSSCNPETLKRDQDLLARDYKVKSTHAFDMFNLTEHLEVLCELELLT